MVNMDRKGNEVIEIYEMRHRVFEHPQFDMIGQNIERKCFIQGRDKPLGYFKIEYGDRNITVWILTVK